MVVPQDRNHPGRHRPEEAEEVIVFFVGAHRWKEEHGGETVVQVGHGQPYEFFEHHVQHCRSGVKNPVTAAAPLSSTFQTWLFLADGRQF